MSWPLDGRRTRKLRSTNADFRSKSAEAQVQISEFEPSAASGRKGKGGDWGSPKEMARCKWALLSLMTIALWCSSCCDAATIASSFLKAAQQKLAPNSAKSSNRMAAFGFSPSSPLAAYWKQRVASLSSSMGWSMVDYNFTKPQAAGPASTLAIAFLSRQDFLGDGWLTKLQSCLDLCGGETGCSPSIVFLVEGRNESGVARAEQAVMELANTSAAGGLLKVRAAGVKAESLRFLLFEDLTTSCGRWNGSTLRGATRVGYCLLCQTLFPVHSHRRAVRVPPLGFHLQES